MGSCDYCDNRAVTTCYQCDNTLCDAHKNECKNCNDITCGACGRKCPECNQWRCDDDNKYDETRACIMTRCGTCDRTVCDGCGMKDDESRTGFTCDKC